MALKLRVISDHYKALGKRSSQPVRRHRRPDRPRAGQRLDPAGPGPLRLQPPLQGRLPRRPVDARGHQHQRRLHQRLGHARPRSTAPIRCRTATGCGSATTKSSSASTSATISPPTRAARSRAAARAQQVERQAAPRATRIWAKNSISPTCSATLLIAAAPIAGRRAPRRRPARRST